MLAVTSEVISQALNIALFGMLGIFGVLGSLLIVVAILNKVTKSKNSDE